MAMGVKPQKISKGLDGNGGPGNGFFPRNTMLIIDFQSFPDAAAEFQEEFSIIEKIFSQDFGDAENEMPMWDGFNHILTEPFPEFHYPLLVAGGVSRIIYLIHHNT